MGHPNHASKGFQRPIQIFTKPDISPSQSQRSYSATPSHTITSSHTSSKKVYTCLTLPSPFSYENEEEHEENSEKNKEESQESEKTDNVTEIVQRHENICVKEQGDVNKTVVKEEQNVCSVVISEQKKESCKKECKNENVSDDCEKNLERQRKHDKSVGKVEETSKSNDVVNNLNKSESNEAEMRIFEGANKNDSEMETDNASVTQLSSEVKIDSIVDSVSNLEEKKLDNT